MWTSLPENKRAIINLSNGPLQWFKSWNFSFFDTPCTVLAIESTHTGSTAFARARVRAQLARIFPGKRPRGEGEEGGEVRGYLNVQREGIPSRDTCRIADVSRLNTCQPAQIQRLEREREEICTQLPFEADSA